MAEKENTSVSSLPPELIFDCGITLCKTGDGGIHTGDAFYDECPSCGQKKDSIEETIEDSAAGRMLGFCKTPRTGLKGVRSACSFTWAMRPDNFFHSDKKETIIDEYGQTFSRDEFGKILEESPIRFYDSIGKEFS